MIRKTIFWIHLTCGVLSAAVIVTMSFTGVLLTYERQIMAWAASKHYVPTEEQSVPMSLDELISLEKLHNPESNATSLTILNNPGAPLTFSAGRFGGTSLNPYSGDEMNVESPGLDSFFSNITGFHRWFNLQGESRDTARAITGASNLIFLFLIISGLYLWLPSVYKWAMFRSRLLFNAKATTGKARDYNWHHVFGFWMAIPLIAIVATATVFYYPWANNLVYTLAGEEPPVRGRGAGGPPPGGGSGRGQAANIQPAPQSQPLMTIDQLITGLREDIDNWRQLRVTLPAVNSPELQVSVDYGNGAQPQLQETLTLSRTTGEIIDTSGFSDRSPGQRARTVVRYLHTGEVLGFWGQTIAGLVSLFSLLMVWTGLALAWRRLISPLFRKKRQ